LSEIGELAMWVNRNRTSFAGGDCSTVGGNHSMQWFAAYTTPRHEKRVAELLTERGVETFLPLYPSTRQWKKSCPVVLELPLFPTYVFVNITQSARGAVLGTPGVASIVGSAKEAWPLPDFEIEALRLGMQTHKIEPHPYLKLGERVRIKSGVMCGVEGILVRKKNDFRVVLTLDTIMSSVAIEVDADDLEATCPLSKAIFPRGHKTLCEGTNPLRAQNA
jgi:transcription antitermination factor NusG